MRAYEFTHVVGFEETNLIGTIYYVNHLRWLGLCREEFLRRHAPEILDQLSRGLVLATTRCSCDYLGELSAFDEVLIRMRLGGLTQNKLALLFEFWRRGDDAEELVARGEQHIACMLREEGRLRPTPVPESLRAALALYADLGAFRGPGPAPSRSTTA